MGQKIHPYGFRVGVTRPWRSRWYARKDQFGDMLIEDSRIRRHILSNYRDAAIPLVEIERNSNDRVTVIIHTAKSGMLLGKKTNRLTELERELSALAGGKQIDTRLREVNRPEVDAQLRALSIAEQLERRQPFRRAAKRMVDEVKQAGALGVKVVMSGRLGGAELARVEKAVWGSIPLNTLDADVDYGFAEARTLAGIIGIKVWIYRGRISDQAEAEAAGQQQGPRGRKGGR